MRVKPLKLWALLIVAGLLLGGSLPVFAQTLGDKLSKKTQAGEDDRLLVEAKEIVYDNDKNTVSAIGNAQLYYQGKVLEADKVTYDNATKRVTATGNVRMREPTGEVGYGDFMELSNDFKDGFIRSLRIIRKDLSRFAAPQAQRIDGDTTIFDKGTYTACEPCKDDPEKPPLWQVRAARIIHKNEERMVYYENATLEFGGFPLLYFPYMSAPDPTFHKKTGFLAPKYIANTTLGTGISLPFFWNLAPDYDLLLTPTLLSRQGLLMRADWRQRLDDGVYTVKLTGINQMDQSAFAPSPGGAGGREWRGMAETSGLFYLNEKWKAGWDASLVSDRWFIKNYRMKSESLTSFITNSLQTSTSTAYLTGEGERSLFDMRSFYFKTLTSANDSQKIQPIVLPVVDYDRRFETPMAFGGETRLTMNYTSLSRQDADYHSIYRSVGLYGDYTQNGFSTCQPGQFTRGNCILRGTAGSSNRVTSELAWRRTFIDDFGQSWTPFGSVRTDASFLAYDKSGVNAYQSNFINADSQAIARPSAATGITYRFPFVARQWNMTHVIEPIGQLVVRPNEWMANKIPNEDSQSLVFDDTNLFSINKFSGYDRVEGGTRANVGAKYSITADNGMSGNVLFGQSFHLSGVNSFTQGGVAAVGPLSGLDRAKSDYVGRVQFIPTSAYSFTTKARFDELTGATKRLEFTSALNFGSLSTSLTFGRYAPQPENGYAYKREGALGSARYAINQNYYVFGGTAVDMARKEAEIALVGSSNRTSGLPIVSGVFGGAGYKDECSLFEVSYSEAMGGATLGVAQRNRTLMFRIELRTLGGTRFSQSSNTEQ